MRQWAESEWKKWGKQNPYWAVSTLPEFDKPQLDAEDLAEFFRRGESQVSYIFERLDRAFGVTAFGTGLDFGCGTGRILLPLARRVDRAIGVDISEHMLAEAARNATIQGVANIQLYRFPDDLGQLPATIDYFQTLHVLQHLRVAEGMSILRDLLGRLGPRGVGVIHFPFQIDEAPLKRWARWAYNNVPYSYVAANLIRGQKPFAPPMFMHRYSLHAVMALLSQTGCERIYAEVMKYGQFQSLVLMFQKASPGQLV